MTTKDYSERRVDIQHILTLKTYSVYIIYYGFQYICQFAALILPSHRSIIQF